ncbi:MAG: CYTH domain-containing protein [Oleispira sp.]|nr:CYTH domain-containing protein [Oleispira sp.]MBL4881873.1 CYTH domain-containing protein [Oleispira sp.]
MVTHSNPSYYSEMNNKMNEEIELKLRLNASELPLLEQVLANDQFIAEPTLQLLNRYFDTPTMALSQGGAALRIRQQKIVGQEQTDIIQTLKTRGTSAGGLHQRMEWDWPLSKVELDLTLFKSSGADDHLSPDINLTSIGALFTTDFQRKVWLYKQDDTVIEMVLDQGSVSTDEHNVDLLELELELKSGDAEVLFQLAQKLAQQCPVLMSDISKAERGYGLLARSNVHKTIKKDWQGKVPHFDEQQDVISAVKTFFAYQLSAWQRSLEAAVWDKQQDQIEKVKVQLTQLQTVLALFSSIDCLPEAQLLQRQLQQAADAEIEISLIWGQVTLACGHWLYRLAMDGAMFSMSTQEKLALRIHTEQLTTRLN